MHCGYNNHQHHHNDIQWTTTHRDMQFYQCAELKTMSTAVTVLNGSSSQTQIRSSLDVDLVHQLDDLYARYQENGGVADKCFIISSGVTVS